MAQAFTEMTPPQLGEEGTVPLPGSPRRGKNKKRDAAALRKAPQAPKRFKSSYICFFMAKQPDIKEELGDKATVTEISKRSAEMWRNLPGKERQHWEEVAAKDKQRYMMEKQSYTGPWQVPWKRARKDPSAPKRPMSAFLYFSQGRRRKIKEQNPDMKNTEVSRILGEMWRNASEEERRPHVEKEKKERDKYKVAISQWRKEYEAKKAEEQRRQNEAQQAQQQWAPPYSQDGVDSNTPPMQYSQQPYMNMPPPGYAPYPPQPYGYAPPYHQMAAYQYPTNGKQPVILGPNGMPHYQPISSPVAPTPPSNAFMYQPQSQQTNYEEHPSPVLHNPANFDYPIEQVSPEPQTAG